MDRDLRPCAVEQASLAMISRLGRHSSAHSAAPFVGHAIDGVAIAASSCSTVGRRRKTYGLVRRWPFLLHRHMPVIGITVYSVSETSGARTTVNRRLKPLHAAAASCKHQVKAWFLGCFSVGLCSGLLRTKIVAFASSQQPAAFSLDCTAEIRSNGLLTEWSCMSMTMTAVSSIYSLTSASAGQYSSPLQFRSENGPSVICRTEYTPSYLGIYSVITVLTEYVRSMSVLRTWGDQLNSPATPSAGIKY